MPSRTIPRLSRFRFVYAENRVPFYQRLFQKNDGKRMWWKWLVDVAIPDFNLWAYSCLYVCTLPNDA
ncbi:hypothetical protein AbraIFM66951_010030, partial [Aspergillus brasiliensis]